MNALRWPATAALLVALGTLSACGSDDSSDAADPNGDGSTASASPGGGQPGGGDPSQLAAIQQCLEAAGLSDAMPSGGPSDGGTPPSGMPTDFPSEMPTDLPSGMPTDLPSGGPGGALQDPEVQAALEACGITLPSAPGAPSDQAS
jgi:hypothetical protein